VRAKEESALARREGQRSAMRQRAKAMLESSDRQTRESSKRYAANHEIAPESERRARSVRQRRAGAGAAGAGTAVAYARQYSSGAWCCATSAVVLPQRGGAVTAKPTSSAVATAPAERNEPGTARRQSTRGAVLGAASARERGRTEVRGICGYSAKAHSRYRQWRSAVTAYTAGARSEKKKKGVAGRVWQR